jgi:hypothetical protein
VDCRASQFPCSAVQGLRAGVPGKLALWREEGKLGSYLKVNGEMFRDVENVNIPSHAIWRPGMTWEAIGELDPNIRHPMNEAAWNPEARLRDMDTIGVDQAFLYPTWASDGVCRVADAGHRRAGGDGGSVRNRAG